MFGDEFCVPSWIYCITGWLIFSGIFNFLCADFLCNVIGGMLDSEPIDSISVRAWGIGFILMAITIWYFILQHGYPC